MTPEVEAAVIAGIFGVVTVLATVAAQLYGSYRTSKDTRGTLETQLREQRDELGATLLSAVLRVAPPG